VQQKPDRDRAWGEGDLRRGDTLANRTVVLKVPSRARMQQDGRNVQRGAGGWNTRMQRHGYKRGASPGPVLSQLCAGRKLSKGATYAAFCAPDIVLNRR